MTTTATTITTAIAVVELVSDELFDVVRVEGAVDAGAPAPPAPFAKSTDVADRVAVALASLGRSARTPGATAAQATTANATPVAKRRHLWRTDGMPAPKVLRPGRE